MQPQTDSTTLEPLVQKLSYRTKLDASDRAAILALPFTTKNMERAHFIVREREPATHSCLMLRGYSIRSKIVATGHRQIVSIHMKGEMVDLQNSLLEVADHSVEMLTPGKVAFIPARSNYRPDLGTAQHRSCDVDRYLGRWIHLPRMDR